MPSSHITVEKAYYNPNRNIKIPLLTIRSRGFLGNNGTALTRQGRLLCLIDRCIASNLLIHRPMGHRIRYESIVKFM